MKRRKSPCLVFLTCVLAVPTCGALMGELPRGTAFADLRPWLTVGALLGVAHLVIRPVLRFLSAPIGCLTLGLFGLVIDVGLIYACAALVDGFRVSSLLYALLTAVMINAISAIAAGRN